MQNIREIYCYEMFSQSIISDNIYIYIYDINMRDIKGRWKKKNLYDNVDKTYLTMLDVQQPVN